MIERLSTRLLPVIRAHRRGFATLLGLVVVLLWTVVGVSAWFVHDIMTGLPDSHALRGVGSMAQATTLLDVKGRPAFTIFQEQRIEVPLERVSPLLQRAIVAIEDQRFYDHGGVDVVRVAGAALSNLRLGRAAQGGSTLTQQLARQSFLTPDKTIRRKLREVVLASRLEREFSKAQILELYLNKVYFGDGLYGAEAAALGYFGRHASELDIAQAALLAGLVKSPSTYAPTVSPDRARARRNVVLQVMRDEGDIDEATYAAAVQTPVRLHDALRAEEAYGQYFKEEVRKQLVQQFGWERVYQGGLRVHTTLDIDLQRAADAEVRRTVSEIEARQGNRWRARAGADPLQGALVAIDPTTGEVRAMVGGRDFDESHFNRATQARRQPGSAFKPFVYAAAIEQGYSPATLITGLDQPIATLQGAWVPEDEHLDSPTITMRAALRTSSNRAAVQMLQQIGIGSAVRYAERLGLGQVPGVPSLALGSGEVTLLSMTAAYGAFADGGMWNEPRLIRKVETTDGQSLFEATSKPQRAVSEATAFLMTSMLADVINSGTAWTARAAGFTKPAAGKTGTTNDYHDAWFVGYTPTLVTGVWVGYDQPRTIIGNGYAAQLAVPMWARFMTAATHDDPSGWFSQPSTVTAVTICRLSGKLATDACRQADDAQVAAGGRPGAVAGTEYFATGSAPLDFCPLHTGQAVWRVASSGTGIEPPPPAPTGAPAPAATAAHPNEPAPPAAKQPEAPKKRGFWGRIFGRGKSKD